MKTKILSLIAVCFIGTVAFAQTSVEKSATPVDFTVGVNNGVAASVFTWNATGAAITNAAAVIANTDNTVSVIFDGAIGDAGTLSVYATSDVTLCKGPSNSASYVVVAPGNLPLKATVTPINANVCPVTTNNSGAGAGDIGFNLSFFANDGTTPAPVTSFIYQIGTDPAVTVSSLANVTTYALNIDSNYDNTQTGAKVIKILKITQSATVGALYSAATAPTATVNVTLAPVVDGL